MGSAGTLGSLGSGGRSLRAAGPSPRFDQSREALQGGSATCPGSCRQAGTGPAGPRLVCGARRPVAWGSRSRCCDATGLRPHPHSLIPAVEKSALCVLGAGLCTQALGPWETRISALGAVSAGGALCLAAPSFWCGFNCRAVRARSSKVNSPGVSLHTPQPGGGGGDSVAKIRRNSQKDSSGFLGKAEGF